MSGSSKVRGDVYFSADVETDGPIPGPYSMLSFALVLAGRHDGKRFARAANLETAFEAELRPISSEFEPEALAVSGLDREKLLREGEDPAAAMRRAAAWVAEQSAGGSPVLVAYPLGFDWSFLSWYFVRFTGSSPFSHSRGFDIKTAYAVKSGRALSHAGRSTLPEALRSRLPHTHRALDDAREQADIFANVMEWDR